MKFTGWKLFCVSFALVLPFFAFAITRIVRSTQFDDNCTYHFEQALQSEDVDYAITQADIGIQYIKDHNLTSGYTTIAGKSSNEDLQIWYKTMLDKDAYLHSLKDVPPDDIKKYKEYVSYRNLGGPGVGLVRAPEGISVYPHNTSFFVWQLISMVLAILGVIGIIVFINEKASV